MHVTTAGMRLVFTHQNPRCELRARFVQVLSMDKRRFAISSENKPSTSGFAGGKIDHGFVRISSGSDLHRMDGNVDIMPYSRRELDNGSWYLVGPSGESVVGYFDGGTGNAYACSGSVAESSKDLQALLAGDPAVRFIGSLDGNTGQLTVRQPEGNYLRICRWDRLSPETASKSGAVFHTLPQCGCGGSLGSPKVFDSLVDMVAYHFFAFYL